MYEGYHLLGYYLYTAITNTTLFNYVQPEKAISSMSIPGPFGEIFINSNGQRIAGIRELIIWCRGKKYGFKISKHII